MKVQDKNKKRNNIPITFLGDDEETEQAESEQEDPPRPQDTPVSSEEIGEASSYEDQTEVQSRIDEGREIQDDGAQSDAGQSAEQPAARNQAPAVPSLGEEEKKAASDKSEPSPVDHSPNGQLNHSPKPEAPSEGPMLAELIATRAELKRVEAEIADYREKLSRRQADFDNYRKRVERDRGEAYNRMVGDVVTKLLPILDNFRRALDAEMFVQANESEEFQHFLHGVQLILKQLEDVLDGLGLTPVDSVGQPFDPHIHEAVVTEQTEDFEPDTVMQELVRGYKLGDKLLRPAMVKVATRS